MTDPVTIKSKRPLSPHLQVYRLPITAKMSILHRMTGVILSLGTLLLFAGLICAATGEEAYNQFMQLAHTPVGTFVIFGWSVALFYHLSNGVRHMFWDLGYLFNKETAFKSGYLVLLSTVILTVLAWYPMIEQLLNSQAQ